MFYTNSIQAATRPDDLPDIHDDLARDEFARAIALDTFGPRGAWALLEPDFRDRLPWQSRMSANGRVVP